METNIILIPLLVVGSLFLIKEVIVPRLINKKIHPILNSNRGAVLRGAILQHTHMPQDKVKVCQHDPSEVHIFLDNDVALTVELVDNFGGINVGAGVLKEYKNLTKSKATLKKLEKKVRFLTILVSRRF